MSTDRGEKESYLINLLQVLKHRWGLILLSTLSCAVLAALWSFLQAPEFESTATVLIEQEHQGPLHKSDTTVGDFSPDYYETHFELLKSRRVLEKAAEELKLLDRSEYKASPGWLERVLFAADAKTGSKVTAPTPSRPPPGTGAEQLHDPWELALVRFEQAIQIKPVRGTRLAKIIAKSNDAHFAAEIANSIATKYIQLNEEVHAEKKGKALKWFSSNLDDLRKKVEQSQEAIYANRTKYGIVDVAEHQTLAGQRLAELSSELVKLELRSAEAESRYQQTAILMSDTTPAERIDWSKWDDHSEVLSSQLIQVLRAAEIKASLEVYESADHPKMGADAELQQLRERIFAEVRKIYRSLKHERDALATRQSELRAAVDRQKREVMQFDQYQAKQGILDREGKSAQQLYDLFLTGAKEASLASELVAANVVIANPAAPASNPSKPKKVANTILGLLSGLVFGIGLALGLDHWDQSLKGPRDLVGYLPRIAFLGAIPRLAHLATKQTLILQGPEALPALEAVRSIRTSILLSGMLANHDSMVITSPGSNEGKSTLAVNLAIVMAQIEDVRVLLINADLRNSDQGLALLEDEGGLGLADFLDNKAEFWEVIHYSGEPRLWSIPRGKFLANPSELLSSRRMKDLLKMCRSEGFFVIIDTPAVTQFSDPVIIGSEVDGIMLVVEEGHTDREACQLAAHRILQAGGKLMGVVFQKAASSGLSNYYRYAQIE